MTKFVSQDEDVLNALKTATHRIGIDLPDAAMNLGLPPDLLANPDQFVPSQLFNCLLESIARDYHCRDLALKIAEHLETPALGLPTRMMALSKTFGDALAIATQYSAYYRDTGHWQHQIGEDGVTLFKALNPTANSYFQQRSLLGTAQMYRLLQHWSGNAWQPSAVSFSFSDPGARFTDTFKQFFATELRFDQAFDGIHFPVDCLGLNITTANDQLLYGVLAHIDSLEQEINKGGDLISQARLVINQRLSFASCNLEELAYYLNVSADSLSAELDAQGLSFEQLLEQQIAEKANYYLTEFHAPTELILSALMPDNEPRLSELLMARIEARPQW